MLLLSLNVTWNPWKKMTIKNTKAVASKFVILVKVLLNNALTMLLLKIRP